MREGNDLGPGVKRKILALFEGLARTATEAAKGPAMKILQENAKQVRIDIQTEFNKGGDPIQETADLIVEKHEDRIRRSDAQRRRGVLQEVQKVIAHYPGSLTHTANSQSLIEVGHAI